MFRWQLQFYKRKQKSLSTKKKDKSILKLIHIAIFFDKPETNCKLATHCYSILQSQHNILFLTCYYWYVESFSSIDLSQEPTHVPPACQRQVIIPFYHEHTDKLIQAHTTVNAGLYGAACQGDGPHINHTLESLDQRSQAEPGLSMERTWACLWSVTLCQTLEKSIYFPPVMVFKLRDCIVCR